MVTHQGDYEQIAIQEKIVLENRSHFLRSQTSFGIGLSVLLLILGDSSPNVQTEHVEENELFGYRSIIEDIKIETVFLLVENVTLLRLGFRGSLELPRHVVLRGSFVANDTIFPFGTKGLLLFSRSWVLVLKLTSFFLVEMLEAAAEFGDFDLHGVVRRKVAEANGVLRVCVQGKVRNELRVGVRNSLHQDECFRLEIPILQGISK